MTKSRLPALVRTMTATAIDRPQPGTGPVGRPGKPVLAGAALVGVLLVAVPFLVLGGKDDNDRESSAATVDTVLGGSTQETPGEFVEATPDDRASGDEDEAPAGPTESKASEKPVRKAPAAASPSDKETAASKPNTEAEKQGDETEAGGEKKSAQTGTAVTLSAPVSPRSRLSGRCLDVPGGDFKDGAPLWVWDCNDNAKAQQWRFASDGTIRIADKCLDVANATFLHGTPIQITWCNGNVAQQFALNDAHDLVNTVVGMCVDIKDSNPESGAWLQLWSCTGGANQKWDI
ncbi:RICIN domain-containing protein [Streptomyces mutabilis]|uniref:RICIN domain-containing protein n=1 Tax=Streptomyces mutabilis TaxID=67332 RepID=UPI000AD5B2AB|nr:RICIN domain-containing protein [Streptomyces mutabilis]